MLTPFGEIVREIRAQKGLLLKDMADGLDVKSSFLSAIEMGNKSIPKGLVDSIAKAFELTGEEVRKLKDAAELCANKISLKDLNWDQRVKANAFARHLPDMDEDKYKRIMEIMEE